MPAKDDFIGRVFGRLTAIKRISIPGKRNSYWKCVCKCGREVVISRPHLLNGGTKSCGCLRKENHSNIKHGLKNSTIYSRWKSMKNRCKDTKTKNKNNYFNKGIKYSKEWDNFINFFNDMSESFEKHVELFGKHNTTLERVDVTKGYNKENCVWATWEEQSSNRRNNFWFIGINKETKEIILSKNQKEIARKLNIGQGSISYALKIGNFKVKVKKLWSFDKVEIFKYRRTKMRSL